MTNIFDPIAEDAETFVPINAISGVWCKYCGQEGKGYDMPAHIREKHPPGAQAVIDYPVSGHPSNLLARYRIKPTADELKAIGRRAERR